MTADAGNMLEADHASLDQLFSELTDTLPIDVGRSFQVLDLFWARLAVHIRAEHLVVFPAVRKYAAGDNDILAVLDDLRHDHDFFMKELARAVKAMRLIFHFGNEAETIEVVTGLIDGVGSRLIGHNRLEEEMIYPLVAGRVIGDSGAEMVAASALRELQNLPPRFR